MTNTKPNGALGKNLLQALPGLLALALLVWGLVAIVKSGITFLEGLDSDLGTAFVAAASAVFVSVLSLALSKAYETKAAVQKDLREKKTPVYEGIVNTLFKVMFASILGEEQPSEKNLIRFFAETTEKLTIWGSDDVLQEFRAFKTQSQDDPREIIFGFERLLLAIRKDLGHRNRGVGRGDILRLFVTDIDEKPPVASPDN